MSDDEKKPRGLTSLDDVLAEFGYTRAELASPCREGCEEKSHSSYAECLKAAAFQIGNLK